MTTIAQTTTYGMYVNGEWCQAETGATYDAINPATDQAWAVVPDANAKDVDLAVAAARRALTEGDWPTFTATQRGRLMRRLAEILRRDSDELALLETTGNGKLLRESQALCSGLADYYDYFAGAADKLEGAVIPSGRSNFHVYTVHEPVGVVAALIPWNAPLLLATFKLAPALAAGCAMVVKPSEYTPVSTLELARRMEEAGFPAGVFNVVTGLGADTGRALVAHPGVDKVAFTGSTATGKLVAQSAMGHLARVSLELGGKSANVVFDDADLDAAVNGAVAAVFAATGQACIAGSRLLLQRGIYARFLDRLVERTQRIKIGDPLDPTSEMGPVANRDQHAKIEAMVERARAAGAEVVAGRGHGADVPEGGTFTAPTVLTNVSSAMEIDNEEVFGPVVVVHAFDTEEEAIALANQGRYGLAAAVWTNDVRRSFRVARALRAGTVWVNSYRVMSYAVPFGGMGDSGIGRENGADAVKSFTETKAVWVELTGATRDPFIPG